MIDVSAKQVTRRHAEAEGHIHVLAVARLAAVGGAKRTPDLIPLCHPLTLDGIDVTVETKPELPGIRLSVIVTTEGRTGVEMEALCGVSAGLLAVYDMCKATDRGMEIGPVRLLSKSGGASGEWRRTNGAER
jgi:cyclic pyranopterin phosphate synthase